MLNKIFRHFPVLLALIFSSQAFAANCTAPTVCDDFTQPVDPNSWLSVGSIGATVNAACLTAGTTTAGANYNAGTPAIHTTYSIPGCNYASPDAVGAGALRLTPSSNNASGAIVSTTSFPSNQGLQVTFTTHTYGGDTGGTAGQGADGISFYLFDPSVVGSTSTSSPNIGSFGGSLAYSCANNKGVNSSGVLGGYLGLGMDEYGNFLNTSDNTATGIAYTASGANGGNTWGSGTYQPNRIGLRGAGNVNWIWLNANYPGLYAATVNATALQNTCITGLLQDGTTGSAKTYIVSLLSWASGILTVNTTGAPALLPMRVGDTVNITTAVPSNPPTVNSVSLVGTYKVLSVGMNSFTVALPGGSSVSTYAGNGRVSINVRDYAVIPGGYFVLPNTQKISNIAAATVTTPPSGGRAVATPITYKLQLTPAGLLTFLYSYNGGAYQTVLSNWPITTANGPLPANFRFGFAASTGGSRNVHEVSCFVAEPTLSASSAGANTVQAGQVRTGTQIYLAAYSPNSWSGSLVSQALVNTSGTLSVSALADWDGNCRLTGGACPTTGVTIASAIPPGYILPASYSGTTNSRQLLTWDGSAGVGLEWANLTAAQQTVLNSTDANGTSRINWLRGDRTQEQIATPAGPLRARSDILGDIVDSSPTWVGPPSFGYGAQFIDTLYSSAVGSEASYSTFASNLATRLNVVYAGSNDGLVHGFRTGKFQSDGVTYDSTLNDGYEVIGFMPSTVLANANVVGLTNPTYGHNYFVDATPGTGDLYYGSAWHTWLVGGMGPGGAEIYALDVTDPTGVGAGTTPFKESNAASLVKGDWTSTSLASCVNATTSCGNNLGNTYGIPLIRRLHNGQWAIIFGNGLGSTNYHAGVFVGLVNSSTGAVSFTWLDTGSGTVGSPNGIASVSSADLDGDHITDYLYAGDLLGNVWRFDLTSSNPTDWAASKFGNASATPLFTASISGVAQPITTKIQVTASNTGGAQRVILGFGTGKAVPFTTASGTTYSSGTQSVYGVWDWDMTLWNSGTTTVNSVVIPPSAIQYGALSQIVSGTTVRSFTRTNLLVNTLATNTASTTTTTGTRTLKPNDVCWQGSLTCPTANNTATTNTQYGWLFDLPDSVNSTACGGTTCKEQIIYSPAFSGGVLFMNTTIPATTTVGQCKPALTSGWSMGFDMASGGGQTENIFPDASGSTVVASGNFSIVGSQQSGVGTPYIVSVGSQQFSVSQTSSGQPVVGKINPTGGVTVTPVTWEKIR